MNKRFARSIPVYLLAGLLAAALKQYYSIADSGQLKWILAPTAWLVSALTRIKFFFNEEQGFVSGSHDIVIAPACSGANFLIICFCTLVFSFVHYAKNNRIRLMILGASASSAYIITLLVNTARIVLSLHSRSLSHATSLLTYDQLHRLEGISIYFLALSLLYLAAASAARKFLQDEPSSGSQSGGIPLLLPFFWYLLVMLGIPLIRGSYKDNILPFIEHSTFVITVPALIILAAYCLRRAYQLRNRLSLATRSALATACVMPFALLCFWPHAAAPMQSFDSGNNGMWVSSKWYTGQDNNSNQPVTSEEIATFTERLKDNHIRYAYVRAGRIARDGSIEHMPAETFFKLQTSAPDIMMLPWIAADGAEIDLQNSQWRDHLMQSLGRLYSAGVKGVHLNIEPILDNQPGYIDLLREIRERFDGGFFVSHATVRLPPMGVGGSLTKHNFWSREFYAATMLNSDQTVLMGYNTAAQSPKLYAAYMKNQTQLLLDSAAGIEGHSVVVGIPAYEDISCLSNPQVENIPSALAGISAALRECPVQPSCFDGVAIYADWCMNKKETRQYQELWLKRP